MEDKLYQIHFQDCIEFMRTLPDGCVNLIFADPPYNIKKADWDKIENYFEWCAEWIQEASRILAPNGAFWVSHSEPEALIILSKYIAKYGRERRNWITWDKWNGGKYDTKLRSVTWGAYWKMVNNPDFRSFAPAAEFLIYHANENGWVSQSDEVRGFIFEPLRAYLDRERKRSGLQDKEARQKMGLSMKGGGLLCHFWGQAQWILPTKKQYSKLQAAYPGYFQREYENLRAEYENLRAEYESLRTVFHSPGHVSSVWQIPPGSCAWHPTPKPELLLHRVITVTSNKGDVIYEPFAGSAVGCKVAHKTGRKWLATENDPEYVEKATAELEILLNQLELFE